MAEANASEFAAELDRSWVVTDGTALANSVESLSCSVDSSASIESLELDDGDVPFVPAWQRLLDEAGPPDFETSPILAAAERELWDATPHHKPRRPHHRSAPPARRTFSSGQRALLWAAGVLGALAIVIAILIVLNAQDRQDRTPSGDETSQTTPAESPAAAPARFGDHGFQGYRVSRPLDDVEPPTSMLDASEQMLR